MPTEAFPVLLPVLFFFVALMYSSVGLGGGSSYAALAVVFGLNYRVIPTIALTLNLFVTSISTINFWRGDHLRLRLVLPFLVTSIPMAYLGGALHLARELFLWLLLGSLVIIALRIYVWRDITLRLSLGARQQLAVSLALGGVLGFIAGTVGIGGGIFLVPLMITLGLATEKKAAAAGAVFIWLNSLSGLISRSLRGTFEPETILPLAMAVVAGGYLGSHLGARRLTPSTMQKALGIIILIGIISITRRLV